MARAADSLVAEIARRAGRATEEDIADALAFLAEQRRTTRTLSLAQVLIKRKKIYAEEFLDLSRRVESPLLLCPDCGRAQSAKEVDEAAGLGDGARPACVDCDAPLDTAALVQALPEASLSLGSRAAREPGPITRLAGPASRIDPPRPLDPVDAHGIAASALGEDAPSRDLDDSDSDEVEVPGDAEVRISASRERFFSDEEAFESDTRHPSAFEETELDAGERGDAEIDAVDEPDRSGDDVDGSDDDATADSTEVLPDEMLPSGEEEGAPPPLDPDLAEIPAEVEALASASGSGSGEARRVPDSAEIDRAIARGESMGQAARAADGAAAGDAPGASSPGEVIGRAILAGGDGAHGRRFAGFEVLSTLGTGGMGVVYKARRLSDGAILALKVLREGEGARDEHVERFQREARTGVALQHPHIVPIHDVGVFEGVHYFSMDLVPGETLHDKLRRGDRPPPDKGALLLALVARAVHFAHERGIIHRDLKPGNVLVTPEGVPMVTDFGLAKTLGQDEMLTQSGAAIGTPLYMSPEQVKGDLKRIDARSDIFSLGTLLYQLLTGALPFMAEWHVELYNKILSAEPKPPRKVDPRVSRELEAICLRALEKKPEDRYQSARALAEDLERAAAGLDVKGAGIGARTGRFARRRRTALLASVAALVVCAAGAWGATALLESRRRDAEAQAAARARAEAEGLRAEVAAAARDGRWRDVPGRVERLREGHAASEEARSVRLLEAEARLRLGDGEAALRALAPALREATTDEAYARVLLGIGAASASLGEDGRALLALAKAAARAPGSLVATEARILEGRLRAERDERVEARRLLDAALAAAGEAAPGREERRHAQAALAWLDATAGALDLPGADAGTTGDVSGDGRPEILLARGSVVTVVELGPEGPVVVARGSAGSPREAVIEIAAADVDADGRAEAVLVTRDPREGTVVTVLSLPKGDGAREGAVAALATRRRVRIDGRVARGGLACGDVDGDERADIVIATSPGAASEGSGAGGGLIVLRSTREGDLAPLALGDAAAARGASILALAVADLDKDRRAEVILGTGGAGGDDVRVLRWGEGAGGLEVASRVTTGPVVALSVEDVDGDGRRDILVGRADFGPDRGAGAGRAPVPGTLPPGVHLLRATGGAPGFAAAWRDPDAAGGATTARDDVGRLLGPLCPTQGLESARVLAITTGDLTASGAPSIVALAAPHPRPVGAPAPFAGDDPTALVLVYGGAGRGGDVERSRIALRGRALDWARTADLDADGDAELIVGSVDGVRIYGIRGKP